MVSNEIKNYQKAVWDFMEDHATVTPDGKYRIVFTTTGLDDVRKRIWARWVKRYKRIDPDSLEAERLKKAREHENMRLAMAEVKDYNTYVAASKIMKGYYLIKANIRRIRRIRVRIYYIGGVEK